MKKLGLIGIIGLLSACGGAPPSVLLVDEDRAELRNTQIQAPGGAEGAAFQRVFGGTSSTNVDEYIAARVRHLIGPDEKLSDFFNARVSGIEDESEEDRRKIAAINAGSFVWLQRFMPGSPVHRKEVEFRSRDGKTEKVESPAIGVIQLGDSYARSIPSEESKEEIDLPWEFRIGILVHEGRHSDCPNPSEISNERNLRGRLSFKECGHPHGECPRGHEFAGIAACDVGEDRLGPYLVEALFLQAAMERTGISQRNKNFVRALQLDSRSRVTQGYTEVIRRVTRR
jgi:hypothetical protein